MSNVLGALVGTVLIGFVTFFVVLKSILKKWAETAYTALKATSPSQCDIDEFVGPSNPINPIKVMLVNKLRIGNRQPNTTPIELECVKSPHVEGLWVSQAKGTSSESSTPLEQLVPKKTVDGFMDKTDKKKTPTVIVATIRMGFGHHRLAYSACSWALAKGYTTIFHDLISIESEESKLVGSADTIYSKMSRLSTEIGGPIEYLWGQAMKQGNADGLRIAALEATHLMPLLLAFPKDIPLITTHQLVALTAAAAGFTNVINLVVDNFPQWFLVVPKTLNLTQGPVNYQSFLRMGVPPHQVQLAGHWCPTGLVQNIPTDCKARIERAKLGSRQKPIRLLIPVGGAGAQKTFINGLLKCIQHLVKDGQIELFLNAGDHHHMKQAFEEVLNECQLAYDQVTTTQGVYDFQTKLLQGGKPNMSVTLFAFTEYFPSVATTDLLCRVSDVLTCKPSELAFYPLPKLHIRRVGDHEADSARRAAELGDGSLEARELEDAMTLIGLMLSSPDLLISMNEQVIQNNSIGLYSGCQNAVDWAIAGKGTISFGGSSGK